MDEMQNIKDAFLNWCQVVKLTTDERKFLSIVEEVVADSNKLSSAFYAGYKAAQEADKNILQDNENAFYKLSILVVPKERAQSITNGIEVYSTKMHRELESIQMSFENRYHDDETDDFYYGMTAMEFCTWYKNNYLPLERLVKSIQDNIEQIKHLIPITKENK
jgi:hypothetical protein